jgi:hypothetical protein
VDIFIPAPETTPIETNRFDIDIPIEKMNEEYKEVYEAMNIEGEGEGAEVEGELEDDFVLLANEGVLPIDPKQELANSKINDNEMILTQTDNKIKNPSYKYITKEEKEFLDRQFNKTIKEYNNNSSSVEGSVNKKTNFVTKEVLEAAMDELIGNKKSGPTNKNNNFKNSVSNNKKSIMGLTAKYEDEDEYEDYELDEEGDLDQFNKINEELEFVHKMLSDFLNLFFHH